MLAIIKIHLVAALADGKVMNSLIILKGKNLQSSWITKDNYFAVKDGRWMKT